MGRSKKIGKLHKPTGITVYNDGTASAPHGYSASGYKIFHCSDKIWSLHRMVAELFIPNPENKPFVNHKDGRKYNCRASNLEWATQSENMKHAWATGLIPRRSPKFTDQQIRYIRRIKTHFRDLARRYRVSEGVIQRIRKHKTYKNVN